MAGLPNPAFSTCTPDLKRAIIVKIIEDLVDRTLARMTTEERRDLILSVVKQMLTQMTSEERKDLMEHVVDSFLDGLPAEERQATVRELVPRLLAQMMQSGGMTVDELLWAAMGSLGALDQSQESADSAPETNKQ